MYIVLYPPQRFDVTTEIYNVHISFVQHFKTKPENSGACVIMPPS